MNTRSFEPLPTTRFEQILLGAVIVLLPLEHNFSNLVPGVSIAFLLFGLLGAYAIIRHPRTLIRITFHPVFLAGFGFLLVGSIMETMHTNSDYTVLSRTGQMFLGGAVIASYCRDPKALRAALYSFLIMGLWLGIYLAMSTFGILSVSVASDMDAASLVRARVFENQLIAHNVNGLAYYAALGTAVGLVLLTTSANTTRRPWLIVAVLGCLVAVFLTMSRSGIFIIIVLCAVILFLRGLFRLRSFLLSFLIAFSILIIVPDVVLTRMQFSLEPHATSGRREGRARVLVSSLETISEEPLAGVGAGNFWGKWGHWSSFYSILSESIAGAHNSFFQIIIYWGFFSLLIWLIVFWTAFRCIPRPLGDNWVTLFLFVLLLWMLLVGMFSHNFYDKLFSLGLGVLVGFDRWIRPFYKPNRLGYKGR